MLNTGYEYTARVTLTFTAAEIATLGECSDRHYDLKCKAANKAGFISALRNFMEDGVSEWTFNCRELDFAVKITEVAFFSNDPAHMAMHYALKRELTALADKNREINQ